MLVRSMAQSLTSSRRARATMATAAAVYFIAGRASRVRRRGRSTASRYSADATRPR
jgi:hypothetical protein